MQVIYVTLGTVPAARCSNLRALHPGTCESVELQISAFTPPVRAGYDQTADNPTCHACPFVPTRSMETWDDALDKLAVSMNKGAKLSADVDGTHK